MLFEPKQEYLGLDISDLSLKAAQFKHNVKNQPTLVGLGRIELATGIFEEGELKQPEILINSIVNLLNKPQIGKFTTTYVNASLPETKTFIKMIDVPPMSYEEIPEAIKWEAEHHIPIPIEETYWDWQQIGKPSKANSRLPILLGVAPKNIVESYAQALKGARLIPTAFEIEAESICRSLLPLDTSTIRDAIIIIDIGATRTSLIVFDNNTIQFTVSLPISGLKITQTISNKLSLSEMQAEKAKVLCGLDPKKCHGAMAEILHSVMDELIHRINEAIIFYQEHFSGGHKINQIILCGGGSNFKSIDQYLNERLELTVRRGDPWNNIDSNHSPLKPNELAAYTTAIGLALRNFLPHVNHD
jgi:type IV pilus assembly protein PilM